MMRYRHNDVVNNIDHVKDLMTDIVNNNNNKSINRVNNDVSLLSSSSLALVAQKARQSLKLLSDKNKYECFNDNLFKPYDTYKKKVIGYDDFKSSLIRANANINNNEVYNLASALDKDDTGVIHYENILSALKTIEDNNTFIGESSSSSQPSSQPSSQSLSQPSPPTSSSQPTSSSSSQPVKSNILSNEAREILNQLRQEPYSYDEATTTTTNNNTTNNNNTTTTTTNNNNNTNNTNNNLYPYEYENYIKSANTNYHDIISQPRRHITQIKGYNYPMYRPVPYHRDDNHHYNEYPPNNNNKNNKNNNNSNNRRYRSRSAPPANQIISLAFDESPIIKKKLSSSSSSSSSSSPLSSSPISLSPSKASSMSLYEHLILDKTIINNNNNDSILTNTITTSPIINNNNIPLLLLSTASSRNKTVNSLITQLKGKLMPLRIQLKKFDGSRSGLVNMNEFVAALGSTGIVAPKKQLIELFKESSQYINDISKGHYAIYEDSRAVNIDDFISLMQEKAYTSHNHLVNDHDMQENSKREDNRIFKKVLHATDKVGGDIHRYFVSQDVDYQGWIQPKKLKDALKYLGSNINDNEFSKVISKLDKNDNGLINVHQLDTALNHHVYDYDNHHHDHCMNERNSHSRYSNTFKPQHHHNANQYDEIKRGKLVRKERMQWAKLRNKLITSNDVLNKVFASSPDKEMDFLDRRIDVNDIQRNLAKAGIQLGNDDTNRFKSYLQEFKRTKAKDTVDNYVSAKELCEFLDPKVSYHKDMNSIDSHKVEDGGIFSTHLRNSSSHSNKSFDSSFYSSTGKFLEKSFGQKRRVQQKSEDNISEPSDYWLLEHEKVIDPDFKYGPSFVPRFLSNSNDVVKKEINGHNTKITSNILKQPYDTLFNKRENGHMYGRRNSTQKSFLNKETGDQDSRYKSIRKINLPLSTNDMNDSISSYHSSDSSSKYDLQRWAAKSLADFLDAKKHLGLLCNDDSIKDKRSSSAPRVRFEQPDQSNIYTNTPQVRTLRGKGKQKKAHESPI